MNLVSYMKKEEQVLAFLHFFFFLRKIPLLGLQENLWKVSWEIQRVLQIVGGKIKIYFGGPTTIFF